MALTTSAATIILGITLGAPSILPQCHLRHGSSTMDGLCLTHKTRLRVGRGNPWSADVYFGKNGGPLYARYDSFGIDVADDNGVQAVSFFIWSARWIDAYHDMLARFGQPQVNDMNRMTAYWLRPNGVMISLSGPLSTDPETSTILATTAAGRAVFKAEADGANATLTKGQHL